MYVTVVCPTGKELFGVCDFVHDTVQLSVAVGSTQFTWTVQDEAGKVADLFDGQLRIIGLAVSVFPGVQHTTPPFRLMTLVSSKNPDELPGYSSPQLVPKIAFRAPLI